MPGGEVLTSEAVLFSFGLITDIQYADEEDSFNFDKSSKRYYRNTLKLLDDAVKEWNNEKLEFVLQIGDMIDGKCESYSNRALGSVMECWKPLKFPLYHAIGNHELYNFSRSDLQKWFGREFYYEFSPAPGFRVVVLNSFERSVLWKDEDSFVEHCYSYFESKNPNPVRKEGVDWSKGLCGTEQRFMPYNGGIGDEQISWLENILRCADEKKERVIIASHCQLQEGCSTYSTMLWNYEEVLAVIQKHDCVVCCLYGHDHRGGYCKDSKGIHHFTLPAPLESSPGSNAFATVDVTSSGLVMRGRGDIEDYFFLQYRN